VQVVVRDNNVDQALKALKKKLQREGVFREMKLRRHYEKPSERRAREAAEAVRRARKVERKRIEREASEPQGRLSRPSSQTLRRERRSAWPGRRFWRWGIFPAPNDDSGRTAAGAAHSTFRPGASVARRSQVSGASARRLRAQHDSQRCKACTISCVTFFASPKSIIVLGRKKSSLSTPA